MTSLDTILDREIWHMLTGRLAHHSERPIARINPLRRIAAIGQMREAAGEHVPDFTVENGVEVAHTPSSNRSACALASGVTSAPLSIRAISSCLPLTSSKVTLVRVTVPSEDLAIM